MGRHWLVDGMNVIGSRPTGWWRHRQAAVRELIEQLTEFVRRTGDAVTVVFDEGPEELAGESEGLRVLIAPRRGRGAADDEIVRLVEDDPSVRVVTSDRDLRRRVQRHSATAVSAGSFLSLLESTLVTQRKPGAS